MKECHNTKLNFAFLPENILSLLVNLKTPMMSVDNTRETIQDINCRIQFFSTCQIIFWIISCPREFCFAKPEVKVIVLLAEIAPSEIEFQLPYIIHNIIHHIKTKNILNI